MIKVWFLVIMFSSSGKALATVPQADREQCVENAAYINKRDDDQSYLGAFCVSGVLAAT